VAVANRQGGEDNITVVLFALEEGDPSIEDTFSDLEVPAAILDTPAPEQLLRPSVPPAPVEPPSQPHRVSRALLLVALALLLFAGLAGLALWGLSRAHFVGADSKGHVVVYQGVPWDLAGGIDLYREIYVSRLLAAQLSPEERQRLFDHSLVDEAEAKARVAVYEREAEP
jgi:hypothetical protein